MQEIQLSNGAHVRVRPVPPHVTIQFNRNVADSLPPEPKAPTRRVKMADGHVEDDIVTEGAEWDAYQSERAEWEQACNDMIVQANHDYNTLQRDYSITEWSVDGVTWFDDVPDTWQFPPACERAGIEPCGNPRVDYIGIELLTTAPDWAAVRAVAEGDTAAITDEEAARVRAGFRPGDRRARNAATKKPGWFRRLALAFSRRNADRQGVEPHARPMVSGE